MRCYLTLHRFCGSGLHTERSCSEDIYQVVNDTENRRNLTFIPRFISSLNGRNSLLTQRY